MKGQVLGFESTQGHGVIAGEDGNRYTFQMMHWRHQMPPRPGTKVDFNINENNAEEIYVTQYSSSSTNAKKMEAALLAFFLGPFGAHKFYLGYTSQGWTMLLVSVLGVILFAVPTAVIAVIAFVEFIVYITKSDEDFEQTYVVGNKPWF